MNKNWTIALLLVALACCLWFILTPDRQHDSHTTQHTEIVADHDTITAHGVNYRRIIDSLSIDNYRLDSTNKSLVKGQTATERKLNAKTAEVRTLVAQIREINSDTGVFGHMLDSLNENIESLTFLIVQYEQYADSINNVNDSLKIGYEAMIKEKDKRIAELQSAYDNLFKAYQQLFADSRGLMKDLKRQKVQKKIAVLIGLGGIIKGLIK